MIFNQFYFNYLCLGIGKQPSKPYLAFTELHQYFMINNFQGKQEFGLQGKFWVLLAFKEKDSMSCL